MNNPLEKLENLLETEIAMLSASAKQNRSKEIERDERLKEVVALLQKGVTSEVRARLKEIAVELSKHSEAVGRLIRGPLEVVETLSNILWQMNKKKDERKKLLGLTLKTPKHDPYDIAKDVIFELEEMANDYLGLNADILQATRAVNAGFERATPTEARDISEMAESAATMKFELAKYKELAKKAKSLYR